MKLTTGSPTMDIQSSQPITSFVAQTLVKEKKAYSQAMQEFIVNFDQQDVSEYYILSTKFITEWKNYTGYDQSNLDYQPTMGTPPELYNKNLLEQDPASPEGTSQLKPGLVEGQDYEIVSKAIMNIFKSYKGETIEKKAHKLSNGKKIVQYQYFFLSQRVVADIDMDSKQPKLNIMRSTISRYLTVRDFKKVCMTIYNKFHREEAAKNARIWKMDKDMDPKKYHAKIKSAAAPQMRYNYRLSTAQATLFDKDDCIIEDLAIAQDDILIIQIEEVGKSWVIREGLNEDICENCRKYQVLSVECACKKAKYCSAECRSKDINYHKRRCALAEEQQLKEDIDFSFSVNSRRGICGLSNLGNTCFMNSCLQCLSNTLLLTQYFISKRYMDQINRTNPIGTKGKLTVKYAKMIQGLWCGTEDSYSPYPLKYAISEFQPMFSGYNQHDSQQLLSFLLDGLHEDLNRVVNKPYVEGIDYKGEPDELFAFESWKNYLLRNRSIIVDIFMGQYKSKVVCPDCQFESVTFDPFSTISLPIPQTTKVLIEVYVFYSNYRETPKKISIDCSVKSIKAWKQQVAKLVNLDVDMINFYVLSFNGEPQQFTNESSADRLISIATHERSDIFVVECSKQEKEDMKNSALIYGKFLRLSEDYMGKQTKQSITYKRPFYWKISKLMGQQVYHRMFTFLFRIALSAHYRVSPTDNPETINKYFERGFDPSGKPPFQIFLMSQPVKVPGRLQKSEIRYEKQSLIHLNTPVHQLLFDSDGKLKKVEFQIRFRKDLKEELRKLNTYQDYDKYKRNKEEEDDMEYDLVDCLKEFEKTQKLEVGNEWRCPKCKDFKLAFKSMSLYKTPKILILHLKRFKQKSSYMKSKLASLVRFPMELDLDGYVINKSLPQAYYKNQNPSVNTSQTSKYELYAVSNHYGGLGGGHYTAYAKNNNQWYEFNDSRAHRTKTEDIVSNAAYMLFYRRIDA